MFEQYGLLNVIFVHETLNSVYKCAVTYCQVSNVCVVNFNTNVIVVDTGGRK